MSIGAVGLILLSRIPVAGTYLGDLLPGLMIMSVGMGLTFVPITLIATTTWAQRTQGWRRGCSTRRSSSAVQSDWRSCQRWPPTQH